MNVCEVESICNPKVAGSSPTRDMQFSGNKNVWKLPHVEVYGTNNLVLFIAPINITFNFKMTLPDVTVASSKQIRKQEVQTFMIYNIKLSTPTHFLTTF